MSRLLLFPFLLLFVLTSGCQSSNTEVNPQKGARLGSSPTASITRDRQQLASPKATLAVTLTPTPAPALGYTHIRADGNRLADGQGGLPDSAPLDIPLAGSPRWVTAVPWQDGTIWAVLLDNNFTQAFFVQGLEVTPVTIIPRVMVDIAPLLMVNDLKEVHFITPPINNPGGNHPMRLNDANDHAYTDANGRLFLQDTKSHSLGNLDLRALPDGRLLVDENGRLLLLTDPTMVYDHGVLGDSVEASSITLIEARPEARVLSTIPVPNHQVIEGIAPIWTDWNGDGQREIVVTLSDAAQGAQVALFSEEGSLLAAGPAIGQGFRWRHQIAVAPFGPNGERELAAVLTPHLGGVVEFYQWQDEVLEIVAQVPGFTSHMIGSRNLDMAAAGDFDGDGHIELLLPTQDRMELGGIRRTTSGAEIAWTVQVGGRVSTNIGAVSNDEGQLTVGIGREDHILRLWTP